MREIDEAPSIAPNFALIATVSRSQVDFGIDVERGMERCWAMIVLEDAEGAHRFELEAVALLDDADDETIWDPRDRLEKVIDLLDVTLEDFFAEERSIRFHDDWRTYVYQHTRIRMRGQQARPDLEARELAEIELLQPYLPAALSPADLDELITEVIAATDRASAIAELRRHEPGVVLQDLGLQALGREHLLDALTPGRRDQPAERSTLQRRRA